MSLLDDARAAMLDAKREYGDFLYDQEGDWTRMQNGRVVTTHCRFSVQDPDKVDRGQAARAEILAASLQVSYTDLRVVKVHPDDTEPSTGMVLARTFDGGRLEIVARSQPGKIGQQRTLTAVVRRGP